MTAEEETWWPGEGRATHAVIDLDAIAVNVRSIRAHVDGADVIAVVKANAYGHGAVMVAEAAVAAGAMMVAVACVDEALELRAAGIHVPILVMGPADPSEYRPALEAGLTLAVATYEQVMLASRVAEGARVRGSVHIKVETGMNRYGAGPEDAIAIAAALEQETALSLDGIFTHFADADGPDLRFTRRQGWIFGDTVRQMVEHGIFPGLVHTANTAGTIRLGRGISHAVRLGIGLYGLTPDPSVPLLPGMSPALSLRSRVAQVHDLQPGDTVSYGRTYRAERPEPVALLPVGYADGLPRALSGTGWVGIDGQRAEILGRVCMDQVVVGHLAAPVAAGTPVTMIGDPATGAMTMDDVARLAGTINYEIATGIATRVPRWYVRAGQPVAHLRGGTLRRI